MPAARTRPLALTLVAALALTPVVAHAQTPEEREQAGAYYKAGAEAYFKEDYAQAIINFKAGHDLDPNPMFLYNLSLSYAKLGNLDEALVHAYRAEEMGGLDPQTSAKNRSRIRSYEVRLAAASTAEAVASAPAGCVSDADCDEGLVCEVESAACVAPPPEPASEDFLASIPLSVWGWTGAGVATTGLVLVVSSLIIDAGLDDDIEKYNRHVAEGRDAQARALADQIDGTQSTGVTLLYLGIVSMVAGGGLVAYDLFLHEEEGDRDTDAALVPSVGPDGASVGLRLRF